MTVFSVRTDAPEVRCDLTDTQTDPTTVTLLRMHGGLTTITLAAHAQGVNNKWNVTDMHKTGELSQWVALL